MIMYGDLGGTYACGPVVPVAGGGATVTWAFEGLLKVDGGGGFWGHGGLEDGRPGYAWLLVLPGCEDVGLWSWVLFLSAPGFSDSGVGAVASLPWLASLFHGVFASRVSGLSPLLSQASASLGFFCASPVGFLPCSGSPLGSFLVRGGMALTGVLTASYVQ